MSRESGKIILARDIHNLKPRTLNTSEGAKLQDIIEQQIKLDQGHNYFHYIQNKDGSEFYGLFYQNQRMKNIFKTYGSIMFIDGTYKLNNQHFPVINFVVTDHNRKSRVVGFAVVACERLVILKCILDYFK